VLVFDVAGRRRVTAAQEWTDRDVPASADRLAADGQLAAGAVANMFKSLLCLHTTSRQGVPGVLRLAG
jgi:hypothetical protein